MVCPCPPGFEVCSHLVRLSSSQVVNVLIKCWIFLTKTFFNGGITRDLQLVLQLRPSVPNSLHSNHRIFWVVFAFYTLPRILMSSSITLYLQRRKFQHQMQFKLHRQYKPKFKKTEKKQQKTKQKQNIFVFIGLAHIWKAKQLFSNFIHITTIYIIYIILNRHFSRCISLPVKIRKIEERVPLKSSLNRQDLM